MDGTAVKQIAEMQREIDHLESDILALLSLVKGNDKQGIYWNQVDLPALTQNYIKPVRNDWLFFV